MIDLVHCGACGRVGTLGEEHECSEHTQPGQYRCKLCGCYWRLNPPTDVQPDGSWSLWDTHQKPGQCCDNVFMGDQIEQMPIDEVAFLQRFVEMRNRLRAGAEKIVPEGAEVTTSWDKNGWELRVYVGWYDPARVIHGRTVDETLAALRAMFPSEKEFTTQLSPEEQAEMEEQALNGEMKE